MNIISVVVTLIAVGVLLWAVETYIPMPLVIKRIIEGVVVISVIFWLLNAAGVLHYIGVIHTPHA